MATVIALSSLVARGSVGLKATLPALARLGHEAIPLPTVLLSSHLGYANVAASAVAPETLAAMVDALDGNGWLGAAAAVITGYLPSPAHVDVAAALIGRVRAHQPDALVFCDPVLGDHPDGLYVARDIAEAVRDRLVPLATHLKPNAFELSFLSGLPAGSPAEAAAAARALPVPAVLASSVPAPDGALANVLVAGGEAAFCTVPRAERVPHGTGDLLTALFAAHVLEGTAPREAAALAVAGVARAIAESHDADELLLHRPAAWAAPAPPAMTALASGFG